MTTKLEKSLYKITWPIFIEIFFFILMGTLDTVMLSGYNDLAVAAVGVSNQLINIFGIIISVMATGITMITAQYLGKKDFEQAKLTVKTGILTSFFIGLLVMVILLPTTEQLLALIKTDASIIPLASTYMTIVGVSLVFASMGQSASASMRSYSKPKVVMTIVIIANLMNILLNYTLIYGKFGFPELGIQGAALGTLISRIFMTIALLIMMYVKLDINVLKLRMKFSLLKKILRIGIPAAMETTLWNLSQVVIITFVNIIGIEALIARTYVITILSYIFLFSLSLANGNSIIVGYLIGEDTHEEAYQHTIKAFKWSLVVIVLVTTIINIIPETILSLFTSDPSVLHLARTILYIALFNEIGRSMNLIFVFALRAAGDTIFPMVAGGFSMFIVSVGLAYLLGIVLGWGLLGVFIGMATDEVVRGIINFSRWKSRKWQRIKLLESST